MGTKHRKYTPELLQEAVDASDSVMGVLRFLGMPQAGGTHAHVSRKIKEFGIPTHHFVRYKGSGQHLRRSAADILQVLPFGSQRTKPEFLRRALLESGVPHCCAGCQIDGTWQGAPLTLHVDHRNGDFHDNRLENLRFLCPNCHAQTPNFAGRGKRGYPSGGGADGLPTNGSA
ncbi:hypothetical protein BJ986_002431 [Phycicoccus badiiscoriae]|uniref:HNH nuclease domain-containing protein n=1 Tax=Pedococcus badiiscoriae TaxID=642776 RepID=A0A852WMB8_9MICO|nr:hypothetical protein [Pedococcus badiiscoriae]